MQYKIIQQFRSPNDTLRMFIFLKLVLYISYKYKKLIIVGCFEQNYYINC